VEEGRRPTRRRRTSCSPSACSKILFASVRRVEGAVEKSAHRVPSIFTPCRCAAVVHPDGGIVTRWCAKLCALDQYT
jgi:hypothetical protein